MDHRDTAYQRRERIFVVEDDDGAEHEIPTKLEVCPTCKGKGRHVNPSIDAHGISAEEFHEDPDFAEDYMRGVYDVACYECGGCNVVPVVDEKSCSPDLLKMWWAQQDSLGRMYAEMESERRYGA